MSPPRLDLAELIRLRRPWQRPAAAASAPAETRLRPVTGFGSNPGALRMLAYLPPGLPAGAPLVVALHGCTQSAAGYDRGCGWADMADRLGFALLLPEQTKANNPHLCFNWFDPTDARRDSGELLSIRQMIGHMLRQHRLDPARVFVTGLSAGGAMSSALLACYPELFAAGAIIAGLPYGAATTIPQAFEAMARPAVLSPAERGAAVRAASAHTGPWPRVSVWQGDADETVRPGNAGEIVKQWLALHGLAGTAPALHRQEGGVDWQAWRDAGGRTVVECHEIAGLAHGVPLRPGTGEGQAGEAGPYLLDVGISATHRILAFWGLLPEGAVAAGDRTFQVGRDGQAREVPGQGHRPGLIARALAAAGLRRG